MVNEFLKLAREHYWDTLEPHKELVFKHLEGIAAILEPPNTACNGLACACGSKEFYELSGSEYCNECGAPKPQATNAHRSTASLLERSLMSEFDEIKKLVEDSKFDGYKAAFLGAMAGWEKSMRLAVRYIKHLTGTGFDSEQHYWVHDCETCAEIAKFVKDWGPANDVPDSRGAVEHVNAADLAVCDCETPVFLEGWKICGRCNKPLASR